MNDGPHLLLAALLRTGLILTLSTLALTGFLRLVKVTSPKVRRLAYFAVLVQGCLFIRGPFALPLPESLAEPLNRATATVGWSQPAQRAHRPHRPRDDRSDSKGRKKSAERSDRHVETTGFCRRTNSSAAPADCGHGSCRRSEPRRNIPGAERRATRRHVVQE